MHRNRVCRRGHGSVSAVAPLAPAVEPMQQSPALIPRSRASTSCWRDCALSRRSAGTSARVRNQPAAGHRGKQMA